VRIDADSDLADHFEVEDALAKKGTRRDRVEHDRLVLRHERHAFVRETWISATRPAEIDKKGLSFTATIEHHGDSAASSCSTSPVDGAGSTLRARPHQGLTHPLVGSAVERPRARRPHRSCEHALEHPRWQHAVDESRPREPTELRHRGGRIETRGDEGQRLARCRQQLPDFGKEALAQARPTQRTPEAFCAASGFWTVEDPVEEPPPRGDVDLGADRWGYRGDTNRPILPPLYDDRAQDLEGTRTLEPADRGESLRHGDRAWQRE
jgi:hypothetical protein